MPWFSLPHEVPPSDPATASPLTEIRGIRGVKLANDDRDQTDAVEYSIVLDQPDNSHLAATAEFDLTLPWTPRLPEVVLERGHDLAARQGLYT